jgi:hypothetical protein
MIDYIDANKDSFGVEPICEHLPIAPSTYYAARSRPPSARAITDEALKTKILEVFEGNYQVYGARKIWIVLRRRGIEVGRDHVYSPKVGRWPRSDHPGGLCMWATLTRGSPLLTRPMYSWIDFGGSPAASMRVGPGINSGMQPPSVRKVAQTDQGSVRTQLMRGRPDATRSHDSPWSSEA